MSITLEDIYKKLIAIEEKQDTFQSTLNDLKVAQNNSNENIEQIKAENKILKDKICLLEKKNKKNNIVIFGLNITNNLLEEVTGFINSHLHVELQERDINNIFLTGRDETKKHIKIELVSFNKKLQILKNAHKLKNTNVYIVSDYTKEEREINNILKKHLKKARNEKLEAFIRNNKLYIEKEEYTVDRLLAIEQELEIAGEAGTSTQKRRGGQVLKKKDRTENIGSSEAGTTSKVAETSQKREKEVDNKYTTRQRHRVYNQ